MNSAICEQISTNTLIYVSPARPLTLLDEESGVVKSGIITHRISHEHLLGLKDEFDKLNKTYPGSRTHTLVDTIYRYNDQIMMVDNDGNHKCMMKPIQATFYDKELQLRMVKYFPIKLSSTRFKPSTDYHHRRQMLCIIYSTKEYDMQFEMLFKDTQKHRDVKEELNRFLSDPDYALSLSYKLYVHDTHCTSSITSLLAEYQERYPLDSES